MSKHTPGPWAYRDNGHFFDVGILHDCSIVPIFPRVCIGLPHRQEANARLIAAAPELYAELYNQVKNCPSCKGTGTSVDIMVFVMDGTHAEADCLRCMGARKALAKAEGKQ